MNESLPAHEGGAGKPASSLIAKARTAAISVYQHGDHDDRYELEDMIQDGCVALLQGRAAYYGVIDGLRGWLGRKRYAGSARPVFVPIKQALDCAYVSDPMRRLIADQEFAAAMGRMNKWRPKRRTAWMLRYMDDKSEPQIGAILGVTQGRVSQWLSR